jgi:CPA1 family monovalent cation:H+ antiporter
MLDRKREMPLRLRRNGSIDDTVATQLRTRLDLKALRLTGVEPLE